MFSTFEDFVLNGLKAESEADEKALRDVKLEMRGKQLNDAVNHLVIKWARQLLVDCNNYEQLLQFKALVMGVMLLQSELTKGMEGER